MLCIGTSLWALWPGENLKTLPDTGVVCSDISVVCSDISLWAVWPPENIKTPLIEVFYVVIEVLYVVICVCGQCGHQKIYIAP